MSSSSCAASTSSSDDECLKRPRLKKKCRVKYITRKYKKPHQQYQPNASCFVGSTEYRPSRNSSNNNREMIIKVDNHMGDLLGLTSSDHITTNSNNITTSNSNNTCTDDGVISNNSNKCEHNNKKPTIEVINCTTRPVINLNDLNELKTTTTKSKDLKDDNNNIITNEHESSKKHYIYYDDYDETNNISNNKLNNNYIYKSAATITQKFNRNLHNNINNSGIANRYTNRTGNYYNFDNYQ